MNIMEITDLYVGFPTKYGLVKAVNTIDLIIEEGENIGILGESGSGKSVFADSILRLIKDQTVTKGTVVYRGQNLMEMDKKELRGLRGKELGMIMQNPSSSLNPSLTIGNQIGEAAAVHERINKKERNKKTLEILEKVRIKNAKQRMKEYAHQFSGGMKERAVIAMGIAQSPRFLIADEPTKGLDTLVKYKVVQLLKEVSENKTMLLITHDLDVAEQICDRIGILYLGEFVEISAVDALYRTQLHPYTEGFFKAMPKNGMLPIEGLPGSLIDLPEGCRFHPRCPKCMERCKKEHPPLYTKQDGRKVRCFLYADSE